MAGFDYDVVIVGSGFGGSVAALRAAEKGYRVGVMESGRRWKDEDIPKTQWDLPGFLWFPAAELYGLQRIEYLDDVLILCGAGVGGGSHIYANTLYVPPKKFFDAPGWDRPQREGDVRADPWPRPLWEAHGHWSRSRSHRGRAAPIDRRRQIDPRLCLGHDRRYRGHAPLRRADRRPTDDRDFFPRAGRGGGRPKIYYKEWGQGQPIVFSHGWPLSADDWDQQMLFFLKHGYRVIAHDRRGHGRSTQTCSGHDMDHYADDLAALTAYLDLKEAVHVGHSTGGGEVVHYLGRHGEKRVAKAVLISAVPPLMVKTPANPGGLPKEVFDGWQEAVASHRAQFYYDLPAGPFYGYNRPGAKPSQAVIWNWWRQGMMGGAKDQYDGIVAFSQVDFTEDLKKITVPVLVMHGDDDQVVPYADSAPLSAKLLKNGTLKTYKGFPHGMPTTNAETINADILAFLKQPAGSAKREPALV